MGVSRFQAEADGWDRAVGEASREFSRDDPEATVFHENRDDWRLVLQDGEARERVQILSSGIRFDPGLPGRAVSWTASPRLEDLSRGGGEPTPPFPVPLKEDPALPALAGSGITIRVAGHRQTVRVARGGSGVCRETREGGWVRVTATGEHRGRPVSAVAEEVLGSDPGGAIRRAVSEASERARRRFDARPIDAGRTQAVFAPGVGGVLIHEMIGHALEGDTVARGRSWLARKAGPVAPPRFTVIDDPSRGRIPWRWDDEGVEARPTVLVAGGRVTGALLDRAAARTLGRVPTGHGRRTTFRDPVLPRMGATYLLGGDAEEGSAVEETRRGVLVLRMSVGRADPATGIAVLRVTDADAIDHGRRTHPVQPFLLTVSIAESLPTIDAIERETKFDACIGSCHRLGQPMSTSVGAPTFRLGSIEVFGIVREVA